MRQNVEITWEYAKGGDKIKTDCEHFLSRVLEIMENGNPKIKKVLKKIFLENSCRNKINNHRENQSVLGEV